MPFVAKKTGGYGYASAEGRNNIRMINGFLNQYNITLEAQAGIIGNIIAESRLNPWKWQSANNIPRSGYGFFQYTPGSGYTENANATQLLGYGPSKSVIYETPGETPDDGWAQLLTLVENTLRKWTTSVWRSYWDQQEYAQLYQLTLDIKTAWAGGDGQLQWNEYTQITNVTDAAIAFMACYEGPAVPNWRLRADNASAIFSQLSLDTPPEPPGSTPSQKKSKWIYYIRPLWWQMLNRR